MRFDIEKARKEKGLTDTQIAEKLSEIHKFDLPTARARLHEKGQDPAAADKALAEYLAGKEVYKINYDQALSDKPSWLIKEVKSMMSKNTPEREILRYVQEQGKAIDSSAPGDVMAKRSAFSWKRPLAEGIGGAIGGAAAQGSPIPGSTYIGVGLGSAMGGQLYDALSEASGGGIPKTLPERAAIAGMDFVLNSAGQAGVDKAVDIAKPLAKTVLGNGVLRRRLAAPDAKAVASDAANLGIRQEAIPAGIVGTRFTQLAEKGLGYMPTGVDAIGKKYADFADELGAAAKQITSEFGSPLTKEGAGSVIREGARGARKAFKSRSNVLFQNVGRHFQPGEAIPIDNTVNMLAKEMDKFSGAPTLGKKPTQAASELLNAIGEDITPNGTLDYTALDSYRKHISDRLEDKTVVASDESKAFLKRLYGAMVEDISAATAQKGPQALKDMKLAKRYYRFNMENNAPFLEKVLNTDADEKIFKYVISGMKDGGTLIRKLKNNLTEDQYDTVVASVLDQIGMAKPGAAATAEDVFSPVTFLTNWRGMKPEAKEALFGSSRHKELARQLDRLVEISSKMKSAGQMANPSGTGQVLNFSSLMRVLPATVGAGIGAGSGGTGGAMAGAVTGELVAPWAAAKLITSPRFVKWLVQSADVAKDAVSLKRHLLRLPLIASAEPEIEDAIAEYQDATSDLIEKTALGGGPLKRNDETIGDGN